jgi:hypothetical protein
MRTQPAEQDDELLDLFLGHGPVLPVLGLGSGAFAVGLGSMRPRPAPSASCGVGRRPRLALGGEWVLTNLSLVGAAGR